LTISAGSTGSTTIRVTSPSGFSGSNTFSVTANNGCSGTASATYTTSGSTSGNYALSISPSSGNSNDNSYNWYISATDQSTGASSPITYTVTYNTMGTCDSSSYVTPSQFTINQGTTLNNIITVRGVKTSDNYCTISMTIKAPNGATVASGTYTVNQGQNYQQYNYNYPYYNYYPTVYYVTSEPQEAEVAKPTCDSPYEGEIAKAQIFSTSQISTPSEGIYLFVILLIILLLLLALLAYWLLTRSRSGRSNKKDSHSNFKCWSGKNLGRDHPESF
jgi:hypothetical protein